MKNLGSSSKPISAVPLLGTQKWDGATSGPVATFFFTGNFLTFLRGSLLSIFPARSNHFGDRAAPGGGTRGLVSGPGHLYAEHCAASQRKEG